jgi:hypothetical protein
MLMLQLRFSFGEQLHKLSLLVELSLSSICEFRECLWTSYKISKVNVLLNLSGTSFVLQIIKARKDVGLSRIWK